LTGGGRPAATAPEPDAEGARDPAPRERSPGRARVRPPPERIDALLEEALALHRAGKRMAAAVVYRRILAIDAEHPDALHLVGILACERGDLLEGVDWLARAVAARPAEPDFHFALARAQAAIGALDEAVASYERTLSLAPDFAEAACHLGDVRLEQVQVEAARVAYARAVAIRPGYAAAEARGLYVLNCLDEPPQAVRAAHRAWGERIALAVTTLPVPDADADHAGGTGGHGRPDPARRLRIGYLSPHFRDHPVARFLLPLYEGHDRSAVEVVSYAEGPEAGDDTTAQFRILSDGWVDTEGLDDDALALRLRSDGIDVAVDLAGHAAGGRIAALVRAPAPVQLTGFGYPHPTGLLRLDGRLTDAVMDPLDDEAAFGGGCEPPLRLARAAQCYRPPADAPPPALPPLFSARRIAFGSLDDPCKITPSTASLWAGVLAAMPEARLVLKDRAAGSADAREAVVLRLAAAGIDAGRVEFLAATATEVGHLDAYRAVDVVLDTLPWNGAASTCEALWMGVPVVTLAGDRPAGRIGASVLTAAGLGEWIATDREGFTRIATGLAGDPDSLLRWRGGLRAKVSASGLTDAGAFARDVEAVYRRLWQRWCARAQPRSSSGTAV